MLDGCGLETHEQPDSKRGSHSASAKAGGAQLESRVRGRFQGRGLGARPSSVSPDSGLPYQSRAAVP